MALCADNGSSIHHPVQHVQSALPSDRYGGPVGEGDHTLGWAQKPGALDLSLHLLFLLNFIPVRPSTTVANSLLRSH